MQNSDSIKNCKKAEYLNEDISKYLQKNIKYPISSLQNNIQGDVLLSFVISKEGKLHSLKVVSSPDISLSTSSIVSLNDLSNEWSPCKIAGKPVDKEYLIVFRYRIYINTQPYDYNERVDKLIKKQKIEKALKHINSAIKENLYNFKFYDTRSSIKNMLGDTDGSMKDSEQSKRLQNEIITVVDVVAIGITRVETRTYRR
jgi:hypothetical protein